MKRIKKLGLTLAAAAMMAIPAQAIPITGSITFFGGVELNTASAGTATAVTAWTGFGGIGSPFVGMSSLSASAVAPGSLVAISAPWSFVSGPIAAFWAVGGYTFDLTSSSIFSQGGSPATVSVTGIGVLKHAGFDDTVGTWAFSAQDPSSGTPANFTFSAATGSVPDGGMTLLLLGAALSGIGLIRRKLAA